MTIKMPSVFPVTTTTTPASTLTPITTMMRSDIYFRECGIHFREHFWSSRVSIVVFIRSSFFFSATRRHAIISEYFSNLSSLYYFYRSKFVAWNVVNVFSNFTSSEIVFPHSFSCEVILNNVELYSFTLLKSWNLRCCHLLWAFDKIIVFWWSYLSFKLS